MAKSTRQHVFEGMELLPEGLIPFVEKRLESSLTGHWQVEVVQRVQGLKPNSQGTAIAWDQQGLLKVMDFTPDGIISTLNLRRPIYRQTAAYGHFGRTDLDLPWEKADRAEALKKAVN